MFEDLRSAVAARFSYLFRNYGTRIFVLDISKDDLWNAYINGFDESERQVHNCNACRSFIKSYGGLVWVDFDTYKLCNIWEIEVPEAYQASVSALRELAEVATIRDGFVTDTRKLGVDHNYASDGTRWTHLSYELPSSFQTTSAHQISTVLNDIRSGAQAFERALKELTLDSVETVLELIASNSIYRGAEHQAILQSFQTAKKRYDELPEFINKHAYAWYTSRQSAALSRIRNSVIGSLLVDISEGVDLDRAVRSYETKVAPSNYQRRTAVVSKAMVDQAEKTIIELGLDTALQRRFSTLEDLNIKDVFYINRDPAKVSQTLFAEVMSTEVTVDPKKFSKLQEITVDDFLQNVLPGASKVEVLFEGRHSPNLVTMTTAVNPDAKHLFKWDNPHCWCYNGSMADSDTKALVKAAGGLVEGILRCSLRWFNGDDLDLHLLQPDKFEIHFRSKESPAGGKLDVDMNAGGVQNPIDPVENIIYPYSAKMIPGVYKLFVHNFSKRSNDGSGFEVEMEFEGRTLTFVHPQPLPNNANYVVATFKVNPDGSIELVTGTPSTTGGLNKEIWGIETNTFHPVQAITLSPNYWGDDAIGNRHLFLFIEQCKNEGVTRGFFNEFLRPELMPHRTAFELLGAKLQVAPGPGPQLSGLGFSSTQQANFVVRVTGKTTRMLRVKTL